jgi:hypothetical protein
VPERPDGTLLLVIDSAGTVISAVPADGAWTGRSVRGTSLEQSCSIEPAEAGILLPQILTVSGGSTVPLSWPDRQPGRCFLSPEFPLMSFSARLRRKFLLTLFLLVIVFSLAGLAAWFGGAMLIENPIGGDGRRLAPDCRR